MLFLKRKQSWNDERDGYQQFVALVVIVYGEKEADDSNNNDNVMMDVPGRYVVGCCKLCISILELVVQ